MRPDVSSAIRGLGTRLRFQKTKKVIQDLQVSFLPVEESWFEGVLMPIPARKLQQKPEGERAWNWWSLWTTARLPIGMIVLGPAGLFYRIVSDADYGTFVEYELTENRK